jgi:hypothetical protein
VTRPGYHGTDLSKQTGLARGAGVAATVQATYSSTPLISTATHSKRKAEPKATEQESVGGEEKPKYSLPIKQGGSESSAFVEQQIQRGSINLTCLFLIVKLR